MLRGDDKCWFCSSPASKELLVQQGYKLRGGGLQVPRFQPVCEKHFSMYSEDKPMWKGKSKPKQMPGQTAVGAS